MMNKDTYKRELVRMWDTHRDEGRRGYDKCHGVKCEECPLYTLNTAFCENSINAFEIIKAVEKWSKEHPQKHKISQLEYDILQIYAINHISNNDTFNDFCTLRGLLDKGYFEGATGSMYIGEYYINCEVVDDDQRRIQKRNS